MAVVIIESTIVPGFVMTPVTMPSAMTVVVMSLMPVSVAIIVSRISRISMISAMLIMVLITMMVPGMISTVVRAATNSKRKFAVTSCQCRCAAQGCRENAGAKR